MAGLTIKTTFQALNKMTQPILTMQGQVGKFAASAKRATAGIGAGFGRLRGVIAGALGGLTIYKAVQAINTFGEKGDEIARTARMLGLSAEGLQELNFAAKMADMTSEDLALAFRKMNNNLGELKTGGGALYTHLKTSNPQLARQLRTVKDSDEAFTLLMGAIAAETDVQKRASLAQAAFGKSGQALIAMAGDLNAKRKEAQDIGAIISNADIEAAERMHEALKRLKTSGTGLLNNVLGRIAQALAPLLEKWAKWVSANRELIGQRIDEVINKIVSSIRALLPFLKAALEVFQWLKPAIPYVVAGIIALTAAQWALNVAMDANPIGAVILSLTALVAIVIVVKRYWTEITTALTVGWNKVNEIFNNPAVRIALQMISAPLAIILGIIQTIVDLIQGKGWKSLMNLTGPWKAISDMMGLTKAGGQVGTPVSPNAGGQVGTPVSPNAGAAAAASSYSWNGRLDIAGAPAGSKYSGTGSGAPSVTLRRGPAFLGPRP